ncbi:class I adenylate-forming enzyme family protein [Rhodococcus opacus]|uniref:class I adenylate-forming enzyme family protein n=1 Tax=Rhodococcus opacus TaxID=37919 RepID=UPI001C4850F6|nr:fatty acid--CoA ligase family protein [Rhodococcus opacus]
MRDILALEPSAPALQNRGAWLTWGDLNGLGAQLQQALLEVGAPANVPIGMIMRNRVGMVASVLSVLAHRQTVVTMSSMLPDEQLVQDFGVVPVRVVLADRQDWERPGVLDAARAAEIAALAIDENGVEVLDGGRDIARTNEAVVPDTAVLMLTSGTTGPPKRVPLTYRAYSAAFDGLSHYVSDAASVRLRSGVGIVFSPLLHVSGMFALLNAVLAGRKVALMERFAVGEWLDLVREHRPAMLALPPTALHMVMDANVDPADLSFARATMVGSAPLSPEAASAWEERFGIPVLMNYGATEFAGGIVGWSLPDHEKFAGTKRGSAGRAHPGVELRIIDEDSSETMGPDEVGLLEVRAPQVADGDWVRTSDRARIDSDGFLYVVGRADDVIIRGGFKVSTGSVAETIKEHPGIRDAGVIGLEDARLGMVPVAGVERASGSAVTTADVLNWVRDRLSPYQVPVAVHFFDELPRTPSLKVSAVALRKLIAELRLEDAIG